MVTNANEAPRTILVVEDHELTGRLLGEHLAKALPSSPIHVARTVREALGKFVLYAPALVVVDIGLPDGSGLDVTRKMLSVDPAVRVIVYSAHDSEVFREKALDTGAFAFVSKARPADLVPLLASPW